MTASLIGVNASLTNLNLQRNSLKDKGVKVICEALQSNKGTKLASLNVASNGVGPVGAKAVAAMAAVVASVTVINVLRNNFDAESAKMLTELAKQKGLSLCGIQRNQTIANFCMQGLEPADAILLASDLSQADVTPNLTSIDLSRNSIGEAFYVKPDELSGASLTEGSKVSYQGQEVTVLQEEDEDGDIQITNVGILQLAEALRVCASVTDLNLYDNSLKDEGVTTICKAVQSNKETKLASLNFGRNSVGIVGAEAVAAMVAVVPSLTSLDVRSNNIADEGASKLSSAVLGNTKIEVFNKVPIKEMRADSFTELNLEGKNIGVAGGMVVAGLLPDMASLTECKLRVNKLGVEVWTIIFNALCDSTIIFDALCDSPASKITIWDLSREFLGPKIAKPLAEYISVTASLTSVR